MSKVQLTRDDLQNMVSSMMQNKKSNGALVPQSNQQVMQVDSNDLVTVLFHACQVVANSQKTMDHCMRHLHETGKGVIVTEEFEIFMDELP